MARRYHHLGMIADEGREGGVYLEDYDVWVVSAFDANPYGIEWLRYGPRAPVPEIVRRIPHVAFEVDDLGEELRNREVLICPNRPSEGVTVAFILLDGAPVELLQFDEPKSDPRAGGASPLLPPSVAGALPRGAFHPMDWPHLEAREHPGDAGTSLWRTFEAGGARTRIVEYSAGFSSGHACPRGHVLYVLDGELEVELADGRRFTFAPGQGFVAGDAPENPHRARSPRGTRVFIVD